MVREPRAEISSIRPDPWCIRRVLGPTDADMINAGQGRPPFGHRVPPFTGQALEIRGGQRGSERFSSLGGPVIVSMIQEILVEISGRDKHVVGEAAPKRAPVPLLLP